MLDRDRDTAVSRRGIVLKRRSACPFSLAMSLGNGSKKRKSLEIKAQKMLILPSSGPPYVSRGQAGERWFGLRPRFLLQARASRPGFSGSRVRPHFLTRPALRAHPLCGPHALCWSPLCPGLPGPECTPALPAARGTAELHARCHRRNRRGGDRINACHSGSRAAQGCVLAPSQMWAMPSCSRFNHRCPGVPPVSYRTLLSLTPEPRAPKRKPQTREGVRVVEIHGLGCARRFARL